MTDFRALATRTTAVVGDRLFDTTVELAGRSVRARSDSPFAESLRIGTAATSITILDADVGDATVDTPVVLQGIDYRVGGPPEPDGMGLTVLRLRRA